MATSSAFSMPGNHHFKFHLLLCFVILVIEITKSHKEAQETDSAKLWFPLVHYKHQKMLANWRRLQKETLPNRILESYGAAFRQVQRIRRCDAVKVTPVNCSNDRVCDPMWRDEQRSCQMLARSRSPPQAFPAGRICHQGCMKLTVARFAQFGFHFHIKSLKFLATPDCRNRLQVLRGVRHKFRFCGPTSAVGLLTALSHFFVSCYRSIFEAVKPFEIDMTIQITDKTINSENIQCSWGDICAHGQDKLCPTLTKDNGEFIYTASLCKNLSPCLVTLLGIRFILSENTVVVTSHLDVWCRDSMLQAVLSATDALLCPLLFAEVPRVLFPNILSEKHIALWVVFLI